MAMLPVQCLYFISHQEQDIKGQHSRHLLNSALEVQNSWYHCTAYFTEGTTALQGGGTESKW